MSIARAVVMGGPWSVDNLDLERFLNVLILGKA
jgi:hypothetical protein